MLLMISKIQLNYMGEYKKALEFAGLAINLLNENIENSTKSTVEYVYAVCCSKYADSQKYSCEKTHLKAEARKHLEISMMLNPKNAQAIYYLARENAEIGNIGDAMKLCEECLKFDNKNSYYNALYALILTMQGNFSKAYNIVDEGYKKGKNSEFDSGYLILGLLKSDIEIYQTINAQKILSCHEKDCLRIVQGYKKFLKGISDGSKSEIEEETKKTRENNLFMKTMREDCLKNYDELIRTIEEEYNKNSGNRNKKYKIGDKSVDLLVALISIMQFYVKACIKLGDIERAKTGYEKIIKEFSVNSPAITFLVFFINFIKIACSY